MNYKDCISDRAIISYLCKIRARLAKCRDKRQRTSNLAKSNNNIHARCNSIEYDLTGYELKKLMPSRKKWIKLGPYLRTKGKSPLNIVDKNKLAIKLTIERDIILHPEYDYIKALNLFIKKLQSDCFDHSYRFIKPIIYPKLKEKKNNSCNICRPISTYPIAEKLIIIATNKYFTQLFDKSFSDSSFAFRSRSDDSIQKNHHLAFKNIIQYRAEHKDKNIYVAECDMRKFYDSVNHSIIKKYFQRLLEQLRIKYSKDAENKFYEYLRSYNFGKNVSKLTQEHFDKYNINNGSYEWLENEFIGLGYYKRPKISKIGIPQGGALSGLIANIVLDYADRCVLGKGDKDLLYIRFCDDIIIMHPDENKCNDAFRSYYGALKKLKLIPHEADKMTEYGADFWKCKTKQPYLWGPEDKKGIPWIRFVGYEINYNGEIRIRKKSIRKEIDKQKRTISEIKKTIENGNNRVSINSIKEHAANKLIGMSVGRVNLKNYKEVRNEMCWVNGFRELNDNRYLRHQLRRLDSSRNRIFWKFKNELAGLNLKKISNVSQNRKHRPPDYYGKPFSYYFHVLEKKARRTASP